MCLKEGSSGHPAGLGIPKLEKLLGSGGSFSVSDPIPTLNIGKGVWVFMVDCVCVNGDMACCSPANDWNMWFGFGSRRPPAAVASPIGQGVVYFFLDAPSACFSLTWVLRAPSDP